MTHIEASHSLKPLNYTINLYTEDTVIWYVEGMRQCSDERRQD